MRDAPFPITHSLNYKIAHILVSVRDEPHRHQIGWTVTLSLHLS